jgi:hypothetical protein
MLLVSKKTPLRRGGITKAGHVPLLIRAILAAKITIGVSTVCFPPEIGNLKCLSKISSTPVTLTNLVGLGFALDTC